MRLYTKKGDGGETGLLGGARCPKDSPRICALGDVDELLAHLQYASLALDEGGRAALLKVEERLFALSADLATPCGGGKLLEEHVTELEVEIDRLCAKNGGFSGFVRLGGSEGSARLNMARAICRRAERTVVALSRKEKVSPACLCYINRLSDYIYALCLAIDKE